jgi:hypothetical protein
MNYVCLILLMRNPFRWRLRPAQSALLLHHLLRSRWPARIVIALFCLLALCVVKVMIAAIAAAVGPYRKRKNHLPSLAALLPQGFEAGARGVMLSSSFQRGHGCRVVGVDGFRSFLSLWQRQYRHVFQINSHQPFQFFFTFFYFFFSVRRRRRDKDHVTFIVAIIVVTESKLLLEASKDFSPLRKIVVRRGATTQLERQKPRDS